MLAEKLLLNLLITISPVLLYSVLTDQKRKLDSPIICGLLQSTAALLCMIFSYANYGFNWDLRYVPLVIAFLYAGPIAGGMVLTTIIAARLLMGGDTVLFGLVNTSLIAIIPIHIMKSFWGYTPNKRVLITALIGAWSLLVCFLSLTVHQSLEGQAVNINTNIPDLLIVGIIDTIAIAISAKLNEGLVERSIMRVEIQKSEKLNTLGELAASIAHEVRNPLTVVKGFLQLMQQEEKGKNYDYFSLVLSELGRAESIINDYLNFAKPQFDKIEEFPLVDVLTEVKMLLDPLALKQGVQLHSYLDSGDFHLFTDRNQLKQALVNLIKNAIEATSEGGKVTITLKQIDHYAYIYIADTGKGMNHEQLSRIGTLFYTTKDKGTGLGTSVSLRIIETMKGKVSYKSKLGIGTEVTMILPEGKKELVNI
ncbi:ATP-binding protein [Bacillus sp. EB106-08-02-XG196]|uniref:ATP-binding protein n=1 Tax=Bacillus sp. EB106-08-02-XG196 TaxID=2737049 RepID=UPI0015C482A2|nr:ATP-binding protein [Bacillus sp. EB106-08-02-XG196]NWQ40629.1 ATP-binding protein [Bacillus sp. EB106-08-02-XG196]